MRNVEVTPVLIVVITPRIETAIDAGDVEVETHQPHESCYEANDENRSWDEPLDVGFSLEMTARHQRGMSARDHFPSVAIAGSQVSTILPLAIRNVCTQSQRIAPFTSQVPIAVT